ncbi:uncharacterized protein FTOL_11768 [Fusarium torulosum]|uniref:Uncharacterized protein n=1 Tax=Fusarium torulosum TaxID=33205 RepID=A0AAE8MKZ0_9HYPO|nr:uncharacterized protein FTOL_11768 [Fusarium torulosum]
MIAIGDPKQLAPIHSTAKEKLYSSLWRGKAACPYHSGDMLESSIPHAMKDESDNAPAQVEVIPQPIAEAAVKKPFSIDTHAVDSCHRHSSSLAI